MKFEKEICHDGHATGKENKMIALVIFNFTVFFALLVTLYFTEQEYSALFCCIPLTLSVLFIVAGFATIWILTALLTRLIFELGDYDDISNYDKIYIIFTIFSLSITTVFIVGMFALATSSLIAAILSLMASIATAITAFMASMSYIEAKWKTEQCKKEDSSTSKQEFALIYEQEKNFHKKKAFIQTVLAESFDKNEVTFHKFSSGVSNVESLFQHNIKSIKDKTRIFDETEIKQHDCIIHEEYLKLIQKTEEFNKKIILKLDEFILEIFKFKENEEKDIENTKEITQLDKLIKEISLYKTGGFDE